MMKSIRIVLVLFALLGKNCFAQEAEIPWEDLRKEYEFPAWYTEARFGIWVHWGAQTAPLQGGGWYARHMYQQDVGNQVWGKNAYPYHNKTYGHPSEIGYKDVLNEWKAERLDTDALISYFKSLGAKYFVALANHHDHFDNFNSTYHPWNSVNVGPKRDIIKEFELSCKKYDIPYGVSSHDDRFLSWWLPAFGSDTSGIYKGKPYDGYMTLEDGKGKWWEGLNPADLYGLPPEKRTAEYVERVKKNWTLRHKELVTKYDIDLLWFDGYGFPYDEFGKEVCEAFFNHRLEENGTVDAVIAGKISGESMVVKDIERGGADEILSYPWQGITTLRTWFYKEDPEKMDYQQNARTIIEILADYMSKNGNLLLNVELLADGTIPPEQKVMLDKIGAWVNLNSEAIYASKPWLVYGDNLNSYLKAGDLGVTETDIKALEEQKKSTHFNERTINSPAYGHDEVRFVTKGETLYVIVLNPKSGDIELPALGLRSPHKVGKITAIKMIGANDKISYSQLDEKLVLNVPSKRPNDLATVFKLEGAL
ncbi:alpha-L-fucosidase [Echinicola marina]|uniref:alpha-L-fucosidase n=1 Tax=Echinicola marina TaxID=2859768 RepID=UPI001CF619F8|nr:alpha-L-fucosidase [Echinicola marina]UCS94879.1 alpha-L-fucosidase [Echinicola marina]